MENRESPLLQPDSRRFSQATGCWAWLCAMGAGGGGETRRLWIFRSLQRLWAQKEPPQAATPSPATFEAGGICSKALARALGGGQGRSCWHGRRAGTEAVKYLCLAD